MILGFILGAIVGALAASVTREPEAEGSASGWTSEPEGLVDKLKHQAHDALEVARRASAQKEAEMMREFEAAKRGHHDE
jgi:hypothetical protein